MKLFFAPGILIQIINGIVYAQSDSVRPKDLKVARNMGQASTAKDTTPRLKTVGNIAQTATVKDMTPQRPKTVELKAALVTARRPLFVQKAG